MARGHRSIGYIGGDSILSTAYERHAGYLDAMAAAGAVVRPEWVAFDAHTPDEAQAVAARFLSGPQAPTALFTAQNLITMVTTKETVMVCLQGSMQYDGWRIWDRLTGNGYFVCTDWKVQTRFGNIPRF